MPLDDRENAFAKLGDLSRDPIIEYLREVKSDLAKEVGGSAKEAPFLINVGLLFFHPEPWRFFAATQIDVVWFRGTRRRPLHGEGVQGAGLPKILRAMRENGSPPPKFRTDDDRTFFATVLPVHPEARAAADDLRGNLRGEEPQVSEQVAAVVAHIDGNDTPSSSGLPRTR